MIYRIFPSKDTFISSFKLDNVPQTGSNFGSCEILHVYKQAGLSGSVGFAASSSLARIVQKYDLSQFTSMTASGEFPSSGFTYMLHLFDAQHDQTLPYSFDLEIQALTQDWDEGRGHDVDYFSDLGVANWDKRKTNTWWSQPGASGTGPIVTAHFDTGHEDVWIDVSTIVNNWLTGAVSNNGFLIKLSSSLETDSSDYYVKMFHSRETFFAYKRPALEVLWDDSNKDNRSNFVFGTTGSLFLYNSVRGALADIATPAIYVRIIDANATSSGTVMWATGSRVATGIYSATFVVPTGSYSGSLFNDAWFSGSATFSTGTFGLSSQTVTTSLDPKRYDVRVRNLKDVYNSSEVVKMKMFVKPHDYNPARIMTASIDPGGSVINEAYYSIVDDMTKTTVVPFGTGSAKFTKLSYDAGGNYFPIYMSGLAPFNVYRVLFLFRLDGQSQLIDQDIKFKVMP